MARPPGGAFDLKPKMSSFLRKRPPVIFEDQHDFQHHEPLEVNVVDNGHVIVQGGEDNLAFKAGSDVEDK